MQLKLNKKIIENKEISNYAIMVYIGIVLSFKRNQNSILTNKNMINYYLTDNYTISRRMDENIRDGLNELVTKNILECNKKIGVDYYFGFQNIQLDQGKQFILVNQEDIRKIMNSNHKNKASLLRFYICLLGTFISKNHIKDIRNSDKYNNILGMMSQEYLMEKCGLSSATIVEYFKILEDYKMIYVSRCSFKFKNKKGAIKRHNNIYGKYINKDIVDEFSSIRYEMYDDLHKTKNDKIVNSKRSLMQKYNCFIKGTKYDKKTIEQMYECLCNYNNNHKNKQKDMKPFEKYGYKI